jgi:hypothetical protein
MWMAKPLLKQKETPLLPFAFLFFTPTLDAPSPPSTTTAATTTIIIKNIYHKWQ